MVEASEAELPGGRLGQLTGLPEPAGTKWLWLGLVGVLVQVPVGILVVPTGPYCLGGGGGGPADATGHDRSVHGPGCEGSYGKDKGWDELDVQEVAAAEALGFEQRSWDEGETPPACAKLWRELLTVELEAARLLGYQEAEWDMEVEADVAGLT